MLYSVRETKNTEKYVVEQYNKKFKYRNNEKEIEKIICSNPDVLGEKLLILGRQVEFLEIDDCIDLLAIDQLGNLVIVELKANLITTGADFQATKYAAYVSNWSYQDIKLQGENYYSTIQEDINFEVSLKNFLNFDVKSINHNQRIIVAGQEINKKFITAASWMREKGVNIKVLLYNFIDINNQVLMNTTTIIPGNLEKHILNVRPNLVKFDKFKHIKDCTEENLMLIESLNETLLELYPGIDGPDWSRQTRVVYNIAGNKFVEYRVNQNSVRFYVNYNYREKVDVKEIRNIISEKLNREITKNDLIYE
ncbi:MAG: hypothetical protein ACOCRK_09585 [bacterium]